MINDAIFADAHLTQYLRNLKVDLRSSRYRNAHYLSSWAVIC